MRLPDSAHLAHPWRIHALAPDFVLEDVWALPTPGGAEDFPKLVELVAAGDPAQGSSKVVGVLFALRWKLGQLLGWDDEEDGLGGRVPTLRDRLPEDLREGPAGPQVGSLPFRPLYLTGDEFAAEIANKTVHGVMHVGAIPAADGQTNVQLTVLVKPNGSLGRAYLAAIKPFRHAVIYPLMMRRLADRWHSSAATR